MSEILIPGAIYNSAEADLTGTQDTRVNLLERFMAMERFVDLGLEGMTPEKAKRLLIGGLAINLEDAHNYPKLDGLMEESIDRQQVYRKIIDEPSPTVRMLYGIGTPTQETYHAAVDDLRKRQKPIEEAGQGVWRDPRIHARRYR